MPRKSFEPHDEEFLKKWAKDYYAGRIFTSAQIKNGNDIHLVFMVLIFADEALKEEMKEAIENGTYGLIYEYYDKAGPRSVNGMPIFMSCAFLCKEDMIKINEYLDKIKEAMDNV